MLVHFLKAPQPLTKSYSLSASGELTKTSYPLTWDFTSADEEIKTLADLEAALKAHASKGNCLLKGSIARPLVKESRAGSTTTQASTQFVVLDIDGLPDTYSYVDENNKARSAKVTVDTLMDSLGLGDVSYVVQRSASYGIENTHLRAHVFMLLDKPHAAPLLKQWLIQLNHNTPTLRAAAKLTKTGNSVSWALDIGACQNDKLIYIAPPKLSGIKDPVPRGKRIELVTKKNPTLALSGQVNTTEKNRALTTTLICELREAEGLPKRKITYKMHGSMEVMVKPDVCTITEMKAERGFVYFNLNGGDSWAYYHPEDNPDYIHSFKGEGSYLTKELLPDYWAELTATPRVRQDGTMHLAFCDRETSRYWRGTYNATTDDLDITVAKTETQVRDFAMQNGLPLGDFIPEWSIEFNPHDNVRVDSATRTINPYKPSVYAINTKKRSVTIPPIIKRVIFHAVGSDQATYDHFINWLAVMIQTRDRTLTAWVLQGTQGTGKGVLMNKILMPLLGRENSSIHAASVLRDRFNGYLQNQLLVVFDEVQTSAFEAGESEVIANLKNHIAEETVSIRGMYAGTLSMRNYCNFMFFSNMADPVRIPPNDRRFNVGVYQRNRIDLTSADVERLPTELQQFYDYLDNYEASKDLAATVLQTSARAELIGLSESSVEVATRALEEGNFGFFVDQLPTDQTYTSNAQEFNRVENYREVLKTIFLRATAGSTSITRDELHALFRYSMDNVPSTPNKFTSLLRKHRLNIEKVRIPDDGPKQGLKVEWDMTERDEFEAALFPVVKEVKAKPKLVRAK